MAHGILHIPTDEQRLTVRKASGQGLPQKMIMSLVGLNDLATLYKHYRKDLDEGAAETGYRVTAYLQQKIEAGDTASITFFCKTKLGFREIKEEERDSDSVEPVAINFTVINAES